MQRIIFLCFYLCTLLDTNAQDQAIRLIIRSDDMGF